MNRLTTKTYHIMNDGRKHASELCQGIMQMPLDVICNICRCNDSSLKKRRRLGLLSFIDPLSPQLFQRTIIFTTELVT